MRKLLPIVFSLVFVTPAFSQSVDAEGATRLGQDLARYVGQTAIDKGVVTVAPEGSAYRIAVDFKALLALFPPLPPGGKLEVSPFSVMAKPLSDGNWEVVTDALPQGSFEFDGPEGHQSTQWSVGSGAFNGVWDPLLGAFRNWSGSLSGMTVDTKEARQEVHASFGAMTAALTGLPAAGGGVDMTMSEVVSDFVETLQIQDPSSGATYPVTLKAPTLSIDATARGSRTRELLDLLAFGVANADEARIKANQAELKQRLLAILPVWNRIDGTYRFNDFVTETPIGSFGAKLLSVGFGTDGAVQNGSLTYKVSLQGLSVPNQLIPAWGVPLLPTEVDLSVSGVGFQADGIAMKLIDSLDLNRDPPIPDEVGNQIAMEFMANPPKVVISRSIVRNNDTEVAAEGEVNFIAGQPEANIAFEATGYDKMVESVQAAAGGQPEITQYLAVALAAKGFAKQLPGGRLRWELLRKVDGSVSVNGVVLKQPDPR